MRQAMNSYFSILELDDHNCGGALGIANVLNEYDKVTHANEIYKLLANSEPNSLLGRHSTVNQGHIAMWAKNFDLAVNLYLAALESNPADVEIHLYLSKAYFRRKDFDSCQNVLSKLLKTHPNELRVNFNYAYCLYKNACEVFDKNDRKVQQTKAAISELTKAKEILSRILQSSEESGLVLAMPPITTNEEIKQTSSDIYRVADETMTYLNQMLGNAEYYLLHDEKRE